MPRSTTGPIGEVSDLIASNQYLATQVGARRGCRGRLRASRRRAAARAVLRLRPHLGDRAAALHGDRDQRDQHRLPVVQLPDLRRPVAAGRLGDGRPRRPRRRVLALAHHARLVGVVLGWRAAAQLQARTGVRAGGRARPRDCGMPVPRSRASCRTRASACCSRCRAAGRSSTTRRCRTPKTAANKQGPRGLGGVRADRLPLLRGPQPRRSPGADHARRRLRDRGCRGPCRRPSGARRPGPVPRQRRAGRESARVRGGRRPPGHRHPHRLRATSSAVRSSIGSPRASPRQPALGTTNSRTSWRRSRSRARSTAGPRDWSRATRRTAPR